MNNANNHNQKSSMSENQKRNLAAISKIDDDIVEKNTARRIKLLAALKKRVKRRWIMSISAAAACLALLAASLLVLIPILGKQVPVYTGMTVSNTAPGVGSVACVGLPTYLAPGNGNGNAYGNKHLWGDHTDADTAIGDRPFDTPITDILGGINVESAAPRYYARPMEDIYITVHVDNPDNFVILSFTLNGQMYSSYMFEEGSDLENLILKVNVGDIEGIVSYTIDAIKYVDGTDIKDAKFDGDRTVEVGVYPESQPAVTVSSEVIGYNTLSFTANAQDALGLIGLSEGNVQAVLYDGEKIVATTDLAAVGDTVVVFDNLKTGTLYQYAIVATYDALDGKGISTYILAEKAFYTKSIVLFDEIDFDTTTVSYSFYWDEAFANKTLTGIVLYQGDTKVREVEVTATAVAELLPDTEYTLVASYQNGEQSEQISITFKTDMLSYTVNHYIENLDGTYEKIDTASETVELGATIAPDTNSYVGFTAPAGQSIAATAEGELVIDYYYTRNSYEVTFVNNDGTTELLSLKYGASLEAAARDGFYFDGFYTEETFQNGVSVVPADALTVFAKWLPETATADLRYAVDGDTVLITGLVNTTLSELYIPAYIGGKSVVRIADAAFLNATSLVSVVIPDSVTEIGLNAFGGCNALTRLTVPHIGGSVTQKTYIGHWFGAPTAEAQSTYVPSGLKTVTVSHAIGDSAFMGCAFLESVTVKNGVTAIGASAFANCIALQSVALPMGLEAIGNSAFAGCTGITAVSLPASVVSLGENIFKNCISLASVTVAQGSRLATLGAGAFDSTAITDLSFLAGTQITALSNGSFRNCDSIITLTIPTGITAIAADAFADCGALVAVAIPTSVISVGSGAFEDCVALAKVTVSDLTAWCGIAFADAAANPLSIAGHLYLGEHELTALEIPADVTSIGAYTFVNASITSVMIHTGVSTIGADAFAGCAVTTATMPTTAIEAIPRGSLATVVLNGGESIAEGALANCTTLQSVVIGESVTAIGASAFAGCTALTEITLPFTGAAKDATENTHFGYIFGAAAYAEHAAHIPATLKTVIFTGERVPADAFRQCTSLTCVELTAVTVIHSYAFFECSKLESVILPETLTHINKASFWHCSSMESLHLPASLIALGLDERNTAAGNPFAHCRGLTSLTVASGNTVYRAESNCVIDIATDTLVAGCKSSVIPTNILTIGSNAFNGQQGITSITLPTGLITLEAAAFALCSGLTEISIPASVTTIGNNAFSSCGGLAKVIISDLTAWCGITFSNSSANPLNCAKHLYLNNTEVTALEISAETTSIGAYAFYNATGIISVTIPASCTTIGTAAFTGCGITTATLPTTAISAIPKTNLKAVVLNGGDSIPANAFQSCTMLTDITVPASVTEIGSSAFYGCTSLADITILANATSIGASAFFGCTSLTSITLPAGVTTIGTSAFTGCGITTATLPTAAITAIPKTNLKTVVLNGGTSIPANAFKGCTTLTSVTIPAGVTEMGTDAFSGCSGLTKVVISDLAAWCGIAFANYSANPITCAQHLYLGENEITALKIPEGITSIADRAFDNCTGITSITIPEGVTSIGSYTFRDCKGIASITIPESVASIGGNAFYACTGMTSVIILASETEIGSSAFGACTGVTTVKAPAALLPAINISSCKTLVIIAGDTLSATALSQYTALENITIAKTFTVIEPKAFSSCPNLISLAVEAGNSTYTAVDNCLIERATSTLVAGIQTSKIPTDGTVTSIAAYAFSGQSNIVDLVVPDAVTSIAQNAFADMTGLVSATLPFIGRHSADTGWESKAAIKIGFGSRVPEKIVITGNYDVPNYAFINCSVKSVTLLGGSKIGQHAFYNCSSLKELYLPKTMKTVASGYTGIFQYCEALEYLIVEDLAAYCAFETNTTFMYDHPMAYAKYLCVGTKENVISGHLEIPEGVISIGSYNFYGLTSITKVTIPSTVTSISYNAFGKCTGITETVFEAPTGWMSRMWESSSWSSVVMDDTILVKKSNYYFER